MHPRLWRKSTFSLRNLLVNTPCTKGLGETQEAGKGLGETKEAGGLIDSLGNKREDAMVLDTGYATLTLCMCFATRDLEDLETRLFPELSWSRHERTAAGLLGCCSWAWACLLPL